MSVHILYYFGCEITVPHFVCHDDCCVYLVDDLVIERLKDLLLGYLACLIGHAVRKKDGTLIHILHDDFCLEDIFLLLF